MEQGEAKPTSRARSQGHRRAATVRQATAGVGEQLKRLLQPLNQAGVSPLLRPVAASRPPRSEQGAVDVGGDDELHVGQRRPGNRQVDVGDRRQPRPSAEQRAIREGSVPIGGAGAQAAQQTGAPSVTTVPPSPITNRRAPAASADWTRGAIPALVAARGAWPPSCAWLVDGLHGAWRTSALLDAATSMPISDGLHPGAGRATRCSSDRGIGTSSSSGATRRQPSATAEVAADAVIEPVKLSIAMITRTGRRYRRGCPVPHPRATMEA